MIQRIQSLFLLLAGVLFASLFRVPFAESSAAYGAIYDNMTLDVNDNIGLLGLAIAGALISLSSIFLFRNRKLQSNLSYLVILLGIALSAYAYYVFSSAESADASTAAAKLSIGIGLPVISSILALMANMFIKKDDNLVKSMDRLR